MAPDPLLAEFEDYLSAGLRLSRQTVDTYVRDCRLFAAWTARHDLTPLTVGTGDVIDFLIARQTEEDRAVMTEELAGGRRRVTRRGRSGRE